MVPCTRDITGFIQVHQSSRHVVRGLYSGRNVLRQGSIPRELHSEPSRTNLGAAWEANTRRNRFYGVNNGSIVSQSNNIYQKAILHKCVPKYGWDCFGPNSQIVGVQPEEQTKCGVSTKASLSQGLPQSSRRNLVWRDNRDFYWWEHQTVYQRLSWGTVSRNGKEEISASASFTGRSAVFECFKCQFHTTTQERGHFKGRESQKGRIKEKGGR